MNTICLSSYLIKKPDPQAPEVRGRPKFWPTDSDKIVKNWIESLRRLNLRGVIFYDDLSTDFIAKWADDNIQFQYVEWDNAVWKANEERFNIYHKWLTEHTDIDIAMTTDLSDVEFFKNPFELMLDYQKLYIGIETWTASIKNCVGRRMLNNFGEITNTDKMILNPGILGGNRVLLIEFLDKLIKEMKLGKLGSPGLNLVAFNRIIYRENLPFIAGPPLHTKFKAYESIDSGCYIRHK